MLGPDLKYTSKAYVVYYTTEAGTAAALNLSKAGITVQALGEDKTEFNTLVKEEDKGKEVNIVHQWQTFSSDQQAMVIKMMMGASQVRMELDVKMEHPWTPHTPGAPCFCADNTIVVQEKASFAQLLRE